MVSALIFHNAGSLLNKNMHLCKLFFDNGLVELVLNGSNSCIFKILRLFSTLTRLFKSECVKND